jgi:5-formyltetrahydrofolate cyclo-ligase
MDDAERVTRLQAKAVLRKRMRAMRNTIPPEALAERSARIVAALEELSELVSARSVALFWPIEGRNEVDVRRLDVSLRRRGVNVAYPAIDPDTREMTFRFPSDPEIMAERGLGFSEPAPEDPEAAELDVIVVPALMVDPRGHRLGYGAGFYDRALARFVPPSFAVAVAYDFQLAPEIPITEGDFPVAAIVTDARTLRASPA